MSTEIVKQRKVTVFSTAGSESKIIETTATNWNQLKSEVTSKGYSLSNTKAVVGQTKVTLESPEAVLPEGDFTLFLLPVKTKSGANSFSAAEVEGMPYNTLRITLASMAQANPDHFKAHFNQGKNYTTKSTGDLKALLISYTGDGKSGAKAAEAPKAEKAASKSNIASAVDSVKQHKEKAVAKEKAAPAQEEGKDLDLQGQLLFLVDKTSASSEKKTAVKDAIKELFIAEPSKKDIDAQLKKQAADLAKGFSDVRL